MKEVVARTAGDVASLPLTVVGLACSGVGYVGTGVRKVGEGIEFVGFGAAGKIYAARDAVGMSVEDMILGIGSKTPTKYIDTGSLMTSKS